MFFPRTRAWLWLSLTDCDIPPEVCGPAFCVCHKNRLFNHLGAHNPSCDETEHSVCL